MLRTAALRASQVSSTCLSGALPPIDSDLKHGCLKCG